MLSNSYLYIVFDRVIRCEITHSKNESLPIVFTQSVHPMRVYNPEYQPPVTSGSRVQISSISKNQPTSIEIKIESFYTFKNQISYFN